MQADATTQSPENGIGNYTWDEVTGRRLAGNALDPEGLKAWYADEERGFFEVNCDVHVVESLGYTYDTEAANRYQARALSGRKFDVCLAFGCAGGDDVASLPIKVGRYVAIEPTRDWWTGSIAGSPAEYRAPQPSGIIDLPDASVDLVVSIGALHHVANVEFVIGEFGRILKQGGVFMVREPMISMGDFRYPRHGLTARERGIPDSLMTAFIERADMEISSKYYCDTPGLKNLLRKLGVLMPANHMAYVVIDAIISRLLRFNARYWRPKIWQKLAPASLGLIAIKR